MPSNHKFTFPGEGDHDPGKEPGDIIIKLEEKPHELFQRHGTDLSMKLDISLNEALCGLKHSIQTLEPDRTILISTKPGEVIKHGDIKMVVGEGFPTYRDPFNKGRLIIVFNVIFPDSLTCDDAKKISKCLPRPKQSLPDGEDVDKVSMLEFDGKGTWKGGQEEEEQPDDEGEANGFHHGGHAGGPQCAQQ